VQLAVWHRFGEPEQTLLRQSAVAPHVLASAQGEHEPPQSMSVSLAFLTTSVQLGA
jgi:hypothetical protein